MYDLIIKNGKILDGTGSDAYCADLAIKDGKIARIALNLTGSKAVIDASGLTVTPGFIDSHSHSDNAALIFPEQIEKVEQGITTAIGGNCGNSIAPVGKTDPVYEVGSYGKSSSVYKTMGTFLQVARDVPLGSNLATFVGHNALRKAVMGAENREPTEAELEAMGQLLREGIASGALGISFGLIYAPGCFAKTEELIYLAKVAADCGGMLSAHIRDEGDFLCQACEEFLRVIKASHAKAVFSHHKAMHRGNWGKVNQTLAMIDAANREGYDIYCDVYPYTASHTNLSARFIPKELHHGGNEALAQRLNDPAVREKIRQVNLEKYGPEDDFSWVFVTDCPAYPEYVGLCLNEIIKRHGKDAMDTVCDMIMHGKNGCNAFFFMMCEEDLETILAYPRSMICTDSSVRGEYKAYHPRLRGSFPRVLGKYVRERKVVSLPEMIRKMTSLPAAVYGLQSKGVLKEGFDADICIFDADMIEDKSSFTDCHERAVGLQYVLVNGTVAAENAIYNGARAGKMLLASR